MNAAINIGMHNTYDIQLIDSKTGELKQQGSFTNRLVLNFNRMLGIPSYADETYPYARCERPWNWLACGDGDAEPAYTDSALSHELWRIECGNRTPIQWHEDGKASAVFTYTFPATSSYVGIIKEVGLYCRETNYNATYSPVGPMTRALLKDSEGQAVSFNKTDTDVLIVNVTLELMFTSRNDNFTFFRYPAIAGHILSDRGSQYSGSVQSRYGDQPFENLDKNVSLVGTEVRADSYSTTSDRMHKEGIASTATYSQSSLDKNIFEATLPTGSASSATAAVGLFNTAELKEQKSGYIRYITKRLPTTNFTDETYFKYVVIPALGYFELPNESVLPTYTISNIAVGTGDGETTEFLNPLSYFKENTEVVKKNGVVLTRDVDYTINNVSNVNYHLCFSQDNLPIKVSGPDLSNTAYVKYSYSYGWFCPFFDYATMYHYNVTGDLPDTANGYALREGEPLLIEYAQPVTLNYMDLADIMGLKVTGTQTTHFVYTLPSTTMFYLDYSTDGVEYTELCSTGITGSGSTSVANRVDFDATTARYWRIRTNINAANCYVIALRTGNSSKYWSSKSQLGYRDPYITFTEAPAEGDVITMDVGMDLIFKNSNFVVDIETRVDFYYE